MFFINTPLSLCWLVKYTPQIHATGPAIVVFVGQTVIHQENVFLYQQITLLYNNYLIVKCHQKM